MKKAVMFDLDGTLLPMGDLGKFVDAYLVFLCEKMVPYGYDPKLLSKAIWVGCGAMVKNDGKRRNEELFWDAACAIAGNDLKSHIPVFEEFYRNEFNKAKTYTGENPLAKKAVEAARKNGKKVILATNPLFPLCAMETRLSWVGLCPEDFDDITCYESEGFCKPNPEYYKAIMARHGLRPEECIMIGNDEREDMKPAKSIGMDAFLVTDTVIRREEAPWEGPEGTFEEMISMLETLE